MALSLGPLLSFPSSQPSERGYQPGSPNLGSTLKPRRQGHETKTAGSEGLSHPASLPRFPGFHLSPVKGPAQAITPNLQLGHQGLPHRRLVRGP